MFTAAGVWTIYFAHRMTWGLLHLGELGLEVTASCSRPYTNRSELDADKNYSRHIPPVHNPFYNSATVSGG